MRWPWVSRTAYELLLDERDRLRGQNDELLDQLTRLERRKAGLPEQPRQPRKRPMDGVAIPQSLRELVARWGSTSARAGLMEEIRLLRSDGMPWDEIETRIREEMS